MVSLIGFIFIYLIGGITFLPIIAFAGLIYLKGASAFKKNTAKASTPALEPITRARDPDDVVVKKGWIRLTNQYQPRMPEVQTGSNSNGNSGIISGIQSYVSGNGGSHPNNKKGVVYAVLKHRTLYCYETEEQEEMVMVLPMQEYSVSLFPTAKAKPEGEVYGKKAVIRLTPINKPTTCDETASTTSTLNEQQQQQGEEQHQQEEDGKAPAIVTLPEDSITCQPQRVLYLTCTRNIDKEDWYFGLLEAQKFSQEEIPAGPDEPPFVMMDSTHFDQSAMDELIRQVQSSPSHRETAWINAILGRLFLGMYKTDRLKNFVEQKIRKKIDKTKRPAFLDEIKVRDVDVGKTVPFLTNPRLLSLSPEGELIVEVKMEYQGGLTIEIETDFNWSYSSLMKPIRMNLILAVKLKKMVGRLMFKIKAPPTNRYWLSFFEMPDMEWKILPVVADKQIKWNIVTNAIESRIREVMAETFVLPNMDDTSFCPSAGKGGIFGESVKVEVKTPKSSGAFDVASIHSDRRGSAVSTSSTLSGSLSLKSSLQASEPIKNAPTVPVMPGEQVPAAADTLKLKNRRAESAFELNDKPDMSMKDLAGTKPMESSQSLPQMQTSAKRRSVIEESSPLKPVQRSSTIDSKTSGTSSSTGGILSNLRKRITKGSDSDSDSEESGLTSNVDATGRSSHGNPVNTDSTTSENKKTSWLQKAENFLTNKKSNDHDDLNKPLSEEQKEIYAQRLANMRKRAEERRQSGSSRPSSGYSIPPPPTNDDISVPVVHDSNNSQSLSGSVLTAAASEPLLDKAPPHPQSGANANATADHAASSIQSAPPVLPPRHDLMPMLKPSDMEACQQTQSAEAEAAVEKGDILTNSPIMADPDEIEPAENTVAATHPSFNNNKEMPARPADQDQQQQHQQAPAKPQKPPHLARSYSNTPPPLPKTARPKVSPPLNRATKPSLPPTSNKLAHASDQPQPGESNNNYFAAAEPEQPVAPQLPPRKGVVASEANEDPEVVSPSPPSAPPRKH